MADVRELVRPPRRPTPVRTHWRAADDPVWLRPLRVRTPWRDLALMASAGVALGLCGSMMMTRTSVAHGPVFADSGVRQFGSCHSGGGVNCVVDGDTFWMDGEKIRVADIDAPETHPSRCASEADLGDRATERLQALLNAGPISLESIDRDRDRYGRKLRVVMRDGRSLGAMLVSEGLARRWDGARHPWCGVAGAV